MLEKCVLHSSKCDLARVLYRFKCPGTYREFIVTFCVRCIMFLFSQCSGERKTFESLPVRYIKFIFAKYN